MTSLIDNICSAPSWTTVFLYKSNFGEIKLQKWLPDISVGQHYTVQEK